MFAGSTEASRPDLETHFQVWGKSGAGMPTLEAARALPKSGRGRPDAALRSKRPFLYHKTECSRAELSPGHLSF